MEIDGIPDPGVDQLQERPASEWKPDAVHVIVDGNPRVLNAPNRSCSATQTTIATGDPKAHLMGEQDSRAVATLIGSAAWCYHTSRSGQAVRWPADVPLVITHKGEVYATTTATSCVISVIAEYQAD